MIQIFDWPWMTGLSIVAAIAMAWLVRSSFKRRINRVSRLGTRQLVMRLVPESALRLPGGRSVRWVVKLQPSLRVRSFKASRCSASRRA